MHASENPTGRTAKPTGATALALGVLALIAHAAAAVEVVDFDDLALSPESFFSGPVPGGVRLGGPTDPEVVGRFASRGVEFSNAYNSDFDSWSGFAYSNTSDVTTPGFGNQYSAVTGGGAGPGADNYGVAFGYWDLTQNSFQQFPFDPSNAGQLFALPTLRLPAGRSILAAQVTNTTYAALSMQTGDQFAKAFGGESGADPDWLKVTAYGTNDQGAPLGVAVDFYLADYRFSDPADDYIVDAWTAWDLAALSGAAQLHFNVSSTDTGQFGMNTPAYFAIDQIQVSVDALPGDYNADGLVDAADYTVWRDTLGEEVDRRGAGADGDLSGVVDLGDYQLWRDQYGASGAAPQNATAAPEPAGPVALMIPLLFLGSRRRSRWPAFPPVEEATNE